MDSFISYTIIRVLLAIDNVLVSRYKFRIKSLGSFNKFNLSWCSIVYTNLFQLINLRKKLE